VIGRCQTDIALRLRRRSDGRGVGQLVASCSPGRCDCTECGDVCPLKAARWRRQNMPAIERLFSTRSCSAIWELRLTNERWTRDRGEELSGASLPAIEKYLRRALDSLEQPAAIAVGMMDAWYGYQQWELGAQLIIAGPSKSELFVTFSHLGTLDIEKVRDVGSATKALLIAGHQAKRPPPFDASDPEPGSRRRGEYYAWQVGLPAGSRLFRYGCDRYFNPLKKSKRPVAAEPKKGHPYPRWLENFMFGNHRDSCRCMACGGPGLHSERRQ
jgi:hypothetical protein